MLGQQLSPIRRAQNSVVDAAKDKTALAMCEKHGVVFERCDPDRLQILPNVLRITTEIVMVTVTIPRA